jgi:uncharacterized protein (DUF1330 family)
MAAYLIATYRVTDPSGYEPYVHAVVPQLMASGCEILVADYGSQAIEGSPGDVTVVLKFASKAAAMVWYDSPEYQAIKHLRTDHSEGSMVLVDQWTPPE